MAKVSSLSPGNNINDPSVKSVRTRSVFPKVSYKNFHTDRFGVYHPFFVMEGVEGDFLPIKSSHDVRSFSLKAPLMQDIKRNKDFFEVPMEAILPLNWEKFYCNPTIGDDVPDDCGTGYSNFWNAARSLVNTSLSSLRTYINTSGNTDAGRLTYILRWLVLAEMFYSNGNLISALGCHVGHRCRIYPLVSTQQLDVLIGGDFDRFFDVVTSRIAQLYPSFTADIDGDSRQVILQPGDFSLAQSGMTNSAISFHDFLEYLRDDLSVKVSSLGGSTPILSTDLVNFFDSTKVTLDFSTAQEDYNLARLFAYQISIFHFYSNDHVDFVYSADLYRQLINYFVKRVGGTLLPPKTFTINGLVYEYDACSAKYAVEALNPSKLSLDPGYDSNDEKKAARGYVCSVFSYRRSLRFVDYFTGSRTRPLAVGNVDVNVNSNKVNIVDVTKNIQIQRFLNAVNRSGRKFREYIKALSGKVPAVDYHNPLYLGHTSDVIFGIETDNTGADQLTQANSITSRLQSNGARYQFEVDVDRPCVIIGISYYDIERVYISTTDRQLHHMNRFDMFNPFMQFIGDQIVGMSELGSNRFFGGTDYAFGYQLRHMEYKQRFPVASGGFVKNLPGFIFDNSADDDRNLMVPVQNPDFIRSLPGELDRFFVSLTGNSLGSYFHFIVKDYNDCDASRPMAYAPSIL